MSVIASKSEKQLGSFMAKILAKGQTVPIDKQFIAAFPFRTDFQAYSAMGEHATSLLLSEINEDDLPLIFQYFSKITDLFLEDMRILRADVKGAPKKIQKLTLSRCKTHPTFTKNWFKAIRPSLKSFCLDQSFTELHLKKDTIPDVSPYIEALTQAKSNIRELTFMGMNTDQYGFADELEGFPSLESLDIVHPGGSTGMKYATQKMEFFALKGESCKPAFDKIGRFHREILRITRCRSEAQRDQLYPIKPKTKKPHIHLKLETEETTANSPPEEANLIFRKLNNDCLMEVLSYLSINNLMGLCEVEPFERFLAENTVPFKSVWIDDDYFLGRFSMRFYRNSYKTMFRNRSSLALFELGPSPLCEILSHCREGLRDLTLQSLTVPLKFDQVEQLPPNLTTLVMDSVSITKALWCLWTRELSPTLRDLKFTGEYGRNRYDFTLLNNIRHFEGESRLMTDDVHVFLNNNKESLETLVLTFQPNMVRWNGVGDVNFTDKRNEVSNALSQLKNLKKLHLRYYKPRRPCDLTGLAHLEDIGIKFRRLIIVNKDNIRRLTVVNNWEDPMTVEEIAQFRNLVELDLCYTKPFPDYEPLRVLKQLRTLRINEIQEWPVIRKFLVELPYLTRLEIVNVSKLPLDFEYQLRKYLEVDNRCLQINEGKLIRTHAFICQFTHFSISVKFGNREN